MKEEKKSQRTRLIKLLTGYSESRSILTATLKSKSPMNVIDQFQFLDARYFPEDPYEFAEHYCIMTNLATARGRRVIISQKLYKEIRHRLSTAWTFGGQAQLEVVMVMVGNTFGIRDDKLEHIMSHKEYSPFINQEELTRRIADVTVSVKRGDVFDIGFDKYIYEPIKRPVQVSKEVKRLGNELVSLGFTDQLVLGKAPALELVIRLQDLCNGFEPIKTERVKTKRDGKKVIVTDVTYRELSENPKLDELEELLEEIGVQENQVVIWCSRTNAFDSISQRLDKLEIVHVRYSGAESDAAKDKAEADFWSGEARVFLANQASAAFGLNCLAKADYVVEYCNDSSVDAHYQSQHRVLRGQSKAPKFAYQIYVEKSVEERVITALNVGQELLSDSNTKSTFVFK